MNTRDRSFVLLYRRRSGAALVALVIAGLSLLGSPSAAAAPSSQAAGAFDVCNISAYMNLGVIHVPDGHYSEKGGNYDGILPPHSCVRQFFGWPHTGGWYIAPGACAIVSDKDWHILETEPLIRPTVYPFWKFPNNSNATYRVLVGETAQNGTCSAG